MSNQFLISRKPFIEQLKRQLLEHHYSGSYGGSIPLLQINDMFDGLMNEINILQDKLEDMTKKYNNINDGFAILEVDDKNDDGK